MFKKIVARIHGTGEWTDMEFTSPYSYYLFEGIFGRSVKFLGPYSNMKKEIKVYQTIVEPWLQGGNLPSYFTKDSNGVLVADHSTV
jgi:hypothetical protein